jgi:plasmid maintenance system killer protein
MHKYFEEMEDVYENRHRYSIEWAYKDAQDKLDKMIDKYSDKTALEMSEVYRLESKKLSRQKWYSSVFRNTLSFITVLEFLLSVILVLLVSEVSHQGEMFVSTRMFSFSVIMVFAFIKVFIEQYVLRPSIEKFGWRLYQRTIDALKGLASAQVNER